MYGGMGGMMPGYGGGMMPGMGYGGMMPGMGYGGMMPYGGVSSRPLTTRRLHSNIAAEANACEMSCLSPLFVRRCRVFTAEIERSGQRSLDSCNITGDSVPITTLSSQQPPWGQSAPQTPFNVQPRRPWIDHDHDRDKTGPRWATSAGKVVASHYYCPCSGDPGRRSTFFLISVS